MLSYLTFPVGYPEKGNMRLTTKGRYAVRALARLAALAQGRPVSIRQIAREEALSPQFLEQIFFRLKKAGLIGSIRGPKGGFVLQGTPADVSVTSILDAVGEPLHPAPCTDHAAEPCQRRACCLTSPVWHGFHELIRAHLCEISLQDILDGGSAPAAPTPPVRP